MSGVACRGDVAAVESDAAGGGLPQAHDGAQRRRLAGAVAAEQHRQLARGDREVHAVKDMIRTDMRVHAGELQEGLSSRATSTPR